MILGIGLDMVEIQRVKAALDRFGDRFALRVLLPQEWEYCSQQKDPSLSLAGRFAAKEATSKAFGVGIGSRLSWTDLEVIRDALGKPSLALHGAALRLMESMEAKGTHLSITHTERTAAAMVILEN